MIQRIAVMGAGSLGTILGAYLSKAGRDVVLIDAYQAHVDALNQNGAHITGAVEMTVPVKAITPEQMEGQYDLFFYLAKQTYNDVAIPQMMAHMGEGSVICTGQNGLPERAVSKAVGVHRTPVPPWDGAPLSWGPAAPPSPPPRKPSIWGHWMDRSQRSFWRSNPFWRICARSMCRRT